MNKPQAFIHTTGRTYNGPQALAITVPAYAFDANGDATVEVKFRDDSRNIAGLVTLLVWQGLNDNARDLGRAVQIAYDHGNYATM